MKKKTDGTRGVAKSLMFLPHLVSFVIYTCTHSSNVESFVSYKNKAKCITTLYTLADKLVYSPHQLLNNITYWNPKEKLQVNHF